MRGYVICTDCWSVPVWNYLMISGWISWPSLHVDKCRCNSQPMLGTKHDHLHPFVARCPAICRLFRPVNHDEPCCMFKSKSRCIFVQAKWLRQILEQVKSGATWILNPVEWVTWMMIEFKPQLENYYLNKYIANSITFLGLSIETHEKTTQWLLHWITIRSNRSLLESC